MVFFSNWYLFNKETFRKLCDSFVEKEMALLIDFFTNVLSWWFWNNKQSQDVQQILLRKLDKTRK